MKSMLIIVTLGLSSACSSNELNCTNQKIIDQLQSMLTGQFKDAVIANEPMLMQVLWLGNPNLLKSVGTDEPGVFYSKFSNFLEVPPEEDRGQRSLKENYFNLIDNVLKTTAVSIESPRTEESTRGKVMCAAYTRFSIKESLEPLKKAHLQSPSFIESITGKAIERRYEIVRSDHGEINIKLHDAE